MVTIGEVACDREGELSLLMGVGEAELADTGARVGGGGGDCAELPAFTGTSPVCSS